MRNQGPLRDALASAVAGFVATKITEQGQMALYRATPSKVRKREDRARPGPPPQLAAQKTLRALGVAPTEKRTAAAAMGFHYGLGLAWAPSYLLLRRYGGLGPVSAGLLSGAAMSLLVDEGLTPALGFSAPNRAYPDTTHVRGFVGHLLFGLALAGAAEGVGALLARAGRGHRP